MLREHLTELWNRLIDRRVMRRFNGQIVNDGAHEPNGLHQWVDDRETIGIVIYGNGTQNLHFVLSFWRKSNDDYYLVLYPVTWAGPIIELREYYQGLDGCTMICWKYKPTKQDGKNPERKRRFQQLFGHCDVEIELPTDNLTTIQFIENIFNLASARIRSDNLQ